MLEDAFPALAAGAALTVQITLLVAPLAFLLSLVVGIARTSRLWLIRFVTTVYVEVFRGSSALVQLFFWFYALPLVGITFPALPTAVIGLSLNIAAYGSEVVRGSIQSVDRGQREAAAALGMSQWHTMRAVVLPQAILTMLPPFGNLFVELLKNTSLVSLIALHELTSAGRQFLQLQPGLAVQVFIVVLLIYLALTRPVVYGMAWLERHMARGIRG